MLLDTFPAVMYFYVKLSIVLDPKINTKQGSSCEQFLMSLKEPHFFATWAHSMVVPRGHGKTADDRLHGKKPWPDFYSIVEREDIFLAGEQSNTLTFLSTA